MKSSRMITLMLILMISAILLLHSGLTAQEYAVAPEEPEGFKKEELVQMLAPIALYPDSLISQMLMASTYPLEVVEAERWLRQNIGLSGDALNDALREMPWDPSVKSLCHFPDVLFAMSDKLDQTRKLGDAFLNQEEDVMAVIQELRQKAHDQGNLESTREQKVIIEREIIRIEPADPVVVYVPVYDPFYVYGPWWYPAYLPWYWYYPHNVVLTRGVIYFGSGYFLGIDFFSWSWFDWHRHYIYVDAGKARRFHSYRERHDTDHYLWRHNPRHRRGVAYRNRKTSERYRPELPRLPKAGPEMRGYPSDGFERDWAPAKRRVERRERDVSGVITQPKRSGSRMDRSKTDKPAFRTQPEMPESRIERREEKKPAFRTQPEMPRSRIERREENRSAFRTQPEMPGSRTERREEDKAVFRTQPERMRSPARRGGSFPDEIIQPKSDRTTRHRDTAFGKIGDGNFERRAGERGGYSRNSDKKGVQDRGSRKSYQRQERDRGKFRR